MPFAELKTSTLSLRPYSDVDNHYRTIIQKLSQFPSLLLFNDNKVDINRTICVRLYTLYEFLCRLLYNYSTKTLRKIAAD
jgi:hypothetical protein